MRPDGTRRRWLAPEVIQSSAMDCGPAALKSLLAGYGIDIPYGRLREACQTQVDGTSIDTLEELAVALGLEAEQIMVPADHLLLPKSHSAPAVVLIRRPDGAIHFVVLWRRLGRALQLMDPAVGRRWTTVAAFERELYLHSHAVLAADWRQWASSVDFLAPLEQRLARLGLEAVRRRRLLQTALEDERWQSLARLDAATRFVTALEEAGARLETADLEPLLNGLESAAIPPEYWSVRPKVRSSHAGDPEEGEEGEEVWLRGAVLVTARGRRRDVEDGRGAYDSATARDGVATTTTSGDTEGDSTLPPELRQAVGQETEQPLRYLASWLRHEGLGTLALLASAILLVATGVAVEALLFRALLDVSDELELAGQRIGAMASLLTVSGSLLVLELATTSSLFRIGRRLEIRLRIALLEKLPRLGGRYFHSRLSSDLAHRSHTLQLVRNLPLLGGRLLRSAGELILIGVALSWLLPAALPVVATATVLAIVVPVVGHRLLAERDLRFRTQAATLGRWHLDALRGLVPIRLHSAQRLVAREHESQLTLWARAGFAFQRSLTLLQGAQLSLGFALAIWLLTTQVEGGDGRGLLLVYWALSLPLISEEMAFLFGRYPAYRSIVLRLIEPLEAFEEENPEAIEENEPHPHPVTARPRSREVRSSAPAVDFRGVHVVAGGHPLLEGIDLQLPPASQTAILGPSGAGKSTLLSLLLGFHRPAAGELLLAGDRLEGSKVSSWRRATAWIDPAVHLWNRSFLTNLLYGTDDHSGCGAQEMSSAIDDAELNDVLTHLPSGMVTELGEEGGLVSGGEGQRVRIARALLRDNIRLVLLDEAFRGLAKPMRQRLLDRCRQRFSAATLLCVTHDVAHTQTFDLVVVIESGRVIEVGTPDELRARADSVYRRLLDREAAVAQSVWEAPHWQRWWLERGTLVAGRPGRSHEL